ncbi:MAG: 50S ribosomal protein L9 [Treponema sp.]|jgi:large subunit ribosomal protein L9|nr:50S ribosomal protein L9 [Treponema sp.]
MKVILNKDLSPLGEEGDVKDVARGYARNYLFPRGIALPYTERVIKLFESRKGEIEERKAEKRKDAAGLGEKLGSLELVITMPAGANGKLYGAVTSQTIADELARQGFQIERKRLELAGNGFKSVGRYKVTVKLYENASTEISVVVQGQAVRTETSESPARGRRSARRAAETPPSSGGEAGETPAAGAAEEAPVVQAAEGATTAVEEAPAGQTAVPETVSAEKTAGNEAAGSTDEAAGSADAGV